MCLAIYIAADHPLPLIPWHDERPDFHVIALGSEEQVVRQYLSCPHVRYTGTEEGCGCLFNVGHEYPNDQYEPKELAAADRSRLKLIEYLKRHRIKEILSYWENGQNQPPTRTRQIKPDDILDPAFSFYEGEHIVIEQD